MASLAERYCPQSRKLCLRATDRSARQCVICRLLHTRPRLADRGEADVRDRHGRTGQRPERGLLAMGRSACCRGNCPYFVMSMAWAFLTTNGNVSDSWAPSIKSSGEHETVNGFEFTAVINGTDTSGYSSAGATRSAGSGRCHATERYLARWSARSCRSSMIHQRRQPELGCMTIHDLSGPRMRAHAA